MARNPVNQQTMFGRTQRGRKELSQWFTPMRLANRLVRWAEIEQNSMVFEPSCGDGAFVKALLEHECLVMANDIDPKMAGIVRSEFGDDPRLIHVSDRDFLDMLPSNDPIDWVVLNPPYENGQDRDHIEKALQIAPRVLCLLRTAGLHGVDSTSRIWSQFHVKRIGLLVSRPSFLLGGDATESPRHDFCAVLFDSDHKGQTTVEWLA